MERINQQITPIEGVESLAQWLEVTKELSNAALIRYLEDNYSPFLEKALHWSQAVSSAIGQIPVEDRRPYEGVAEALQAACLSSDVVVISAANPDAMYEEWELHGLAYFVDMILNQNIGPKKYCVSELLQKGYEPKKVLIMGDAMEDLDVVFPLINYAGLRIRKGAEFGTKEEMMEAIHSCHIAGKGVFSMTRTAYFASFYFYFRF